MSVIRILSAQRIGGYDMSDEGPFEKFMKDMDERSKKHRQRQKELSNDEDHTNNRKRDANNREEVNNRVKWPG